MYKSQSGGVRMGFWIFMTIMNLLIPLMMTGFGKLFLKNAPKEINAVFGYRTTMSMKNQDTWKFAHQYCGKLWYVGGKILLVITVVVMLALIGKNEDTVGTVSEALLFLQMIPLIGSIIPTEKALRRTFDKNGRRR